MWEGSVACMSINMYCTCVHTNTSATLLISLLFLADNIHTKGVVPRRVFLVLPIATRIVN